jgi:hypothetical protein
MLAAKSSWPAPNDEFCMKIGGMVRLVRLRRLARSHRLVN